MLEPLFRKSRYLVFIIVFASFMASLLLYVTAVNILWTTLGDFLKDIPDTAGEAKIMAVNLLKSLDILLIALAFQIVSIAHHRFFISRSSDTESRFLKAMHITDFHDLKIILLQVSILILALVFLEQAVEVGATLETLYLALSNGIIIAALVFAIRSMQKS